MGGNIHNRENAETKLETVSTDNLKSRLNTMYESMRQRPRFSASSGLFDYLWDLKEKAILEGHNSVKVPTGWLDELEADYESTQNSQYH